MTIRYKFHFVFVLIFLAFAVMAWAAGSTVAPAETHDFLSDHGDVTKWLLRAAAALAIYELIKMDKNQTRLFQLYNDLDNQVTAISAVCEERGKKFGRRKSDHNDKED